MKLNQALVNQSAVETNQTQGGINMNNVNNEQLKVAVQELKKDFLTRIEALEALLVAPTVVEAPEDTTPEEEAAIFEEIANMSSPVSNQPVIDLPKEEVGGLGISKTPYVMEEVEEIDLDSIQFPMVEKPLDLTHDERQQQLIAEALDFLENPEAHEDATIVTEDEEEEAPAPAGDELVERATSSMKEALEHMNNMEPLPTLEEELDADDEDDIDVDLSEEEKSSPFEDIHIPTKKEKREQAAALEQSFGLALNMALVKKDEAVEQPVVEEPKAEHKATGNACVISGPINQGLLLNSGRISYKHGTKGFALDLARYMYRGVKTQYDNGIREFHVAEFNGIELLVSLFWADIKATCPDAKLVLFTNGLSKFQQYRNQEDEVATGIFSPYRLSVMLRSFADEVVEVKGNAFAVRKAAADNVSAYVRVMPKQHKDGADRFMKADQQGILICPWSLDVFKTGTFEQKFIEGPGVDYAPKAFKASTVATV